MQFEQRLRLPKTIGVMSQPMKAYTPVKLCWLCSLIEATKLQSIAETYQWSAATFCYSDGMEIG
jgi:hypothetical protein